MVSRNRHQELLIDLKPVPGTVPAGRRRINHQEDHMTDRTE